MNRNQEKFYVQVTFDSTPNAKCTSWLSFILKQNKNKQTRLPPWKTAMLMTRNKSESPYELSFTQSYTCKALFEALEYNYN